MRRLLTPFLLISAAAGWAQVDIFNASLDRAYTTTTRVETLALSPDGKLVAIGSHNGRIQCGRLTAAKSLATITTATSPIVAMAFTYDSSSLLAATNAGDLLLMSFNPGSQGVSRRIRLAGKIRGLAVSATDHLAAVATTENLVILLDSRTGTELFRVVHSPAKAIRGLAFGPESKTLLAVSGDGRLWEWDLNTRELIRNLLEEEKNVHAASVNNDSGLLVLSTEELDLNTSPSKNGGANGDSSTAVVAQNSAPSGALRTFGTGPGAHPNDLRRVNQIKIWDLKQGRIVKVLPGVDGEITALASSVDGRFVVSIRRRIKDSYLEVYDVARGVRCFSSPVPGSGTAVSFSGDGRWMASANDRGQVALYAVDGIFPGTTIGFVDGGRIRITSRDRRPLIPSSEPLNMAIIDFEASLIDKDLGRTVADILRNQISGTDKLKIVEREKLDHIIKEINFQFSDRIDPDTAVRLGKLYGIQKIIFGRISKLDTTYLINVRLVNLKTAQEDGVREVECRRCGLADLGGAIAALRTVLVR